MKKSVLYLFLILSTLSCSKEKSKKWLVIDINMTSATTGQPVDASFELWYRQGTALPLGEDQLVWEQLGSSTNGKFYREIELNKRVHSIELTSRVPFAYGGSPPSWPGGPTYNLSMQSANTYNVVLDPAWYETELKLSNLNCFDDTDTTWLKIERFGNWSSGEEPMLGCFTDSIISPNGIVYTPHGLLHLRLITKRNGVLDSTEYTYTLEHETTNDIHIDDF
jgi:hypothetical protein